MFTASATKEQHRKDRTRSHLESARRNGKAAVDELDSAAHTMGKDVRDFLENALDSAGESISQAKEKISDTTETLSNRISDKPLSSAAIAIGIGVILGAFFRRS